MVAIAIVAAAGWLALYLRCAAVTNDRRLRRRMPRLRLDGAPPDLGDPALVNLVTTGCQLDGAAFTATILHLGARRVLAEMNTRAARRSGQPLPGVGETAWLINQGRTAIVQAEGKIVKLTIRDGLAQVPAGAVTRLAEIVAERLAQRSEIA